MHTGLALVGLKPSCFVRETGDVVDLPCIYSYAVEQHCYYEKYVGAKHAGVLLSSIWPAK